MSVVIRRAGSRFVDRSEGVLTHHGFSFGAAYDPQWLSFGPMACHDDHLLGPGRGFEEHPHSDLEIVTWVLSGTVRHVDSEGHTTELTAGQCGVLSAGSGVRHSEIAGAAGPARFVQVWLHPDETGTRPGYDWATVLAAPGDGLVPVVGEGADLQVGVRGATYAVARLEVNQALTLPAAPRLHAYVASGALLRSSLAEPLQSGDAFCMTDEPEHQVRAAVATELLVWSFAAG